MTVYLIEAASFLVAISILIATHEFGHFWVARRLGFKVLRYSIGFGRPVLMRRGRDGIEYVLSAIPLGGYVRLADEREAPVAEADRDRAFNRRPVWQRVLVLVAGAGANFLFAIVAYWALFVHGIPAIRPVIGAVRADSLAAAAGLRPGDEVLAIGDRPVATIEGAVLELVSDISGDGRLQFELAHGTERRAATILVPAERRRALTEPGGLASGLGIAFLEPVIVTVRPDGAAAAAGIKSGDEITSVDGKPPSDYIEFQHAIRAHVGTPLTLGLRRGGAERSLTVTPRVVPDPQAKSGAPIGQIGVEPQDPRDSASPLRTLQRYGPVSAVGAALEKTASTTSLTLKLLWRMVTGRVSIKNVSGPIGIASFAGLSALAGPVRFIEFLALISISLGILNLMPIPILDGGQVVYQLAERIAGRPLPERVQVLGQQLGIVLLILLMSLAFYNDIAWRFG